MVAVRAHSRVRRQPVRMLAPPGLVPSHLGAPSPLSPCWALQRPRVEHPHGVRVPPKYSREKVLQAL